MPAAARERLPRRHLGRHGAAHGRLRRRARRRPPACPTSADSDRAARPDGPRLLTSTVRLLDHAQELVRGVRVGAGLAIDRAAAGA
ncbi:MAG: hypothetical protein MZV64_43430 [Ignavibacteriales bacterium]|nr:hypothetical protein [Ignavibacteriales bacterium]